MVSGQSQAWLLRLQPFSRALVTQGTGRAALLKTAPPKCLLRFWSGTDQVLLVKRQFSAQPRGKAKHSSSSALPGGVNRQSIRHGSQWASGHYHTAAATLQAPLSLRRFLLERRTWPGVSVRFLSSVICRSKNSCRSSVLRAEQQQGSSWPAHAAVR